MTTLTELALYAAAAVIVAVALYGLAGDLVRLYRIRRRLDRRVRSLRHREDPDYPGQCWHDGKAWPCAVANAQESLRRR